MEDVCMLKHGLLPKNHRVSCVMISLIGFSTKFVLVSLGLF